MAHVVTAPCYDCKYTDCAVICPVECFYQDSTMLYIDPEDCIDCEACIPECPVQAIFREFDVPVPWTNYIQLNAERVASIKNRNEDIARVAEDFRHKTIDPAWTTATVLELARQVLESNSFEVLPILADALEEAGCNDRTFLVYCRQGPGGRWPAEWVLGGISSEPEGRITEHQDAKEGPRCGRE